MTSINKVLNSYLGDKRIEKYKYDDLVTVASVIGNNKIVFDWFCYLHTIETVGWRTKLSTEKIAKTLASSRKNNPIQFYALFCPSYKKGVGLHGFRTDAIGNTSRWGINILKEIMTETRKLGIPCKQPEAIFFDIAVEQPEKTLPELDDLEKNISNFKKSLPVGVRFSLLSEKYPFLADIVGYPGIQITPLPVSQVTLEQIIERGKKFYKLFGWTKKQIDERSKIIASSEALVGSVLRYTIPNSIMIYTPTMLERARVYSGYKFEKDPLPIIFPKHTELQ